MDNADMETSLKHFVKQRRAELGLTQVELADRAGVSQPLVSDIERGATKFPDADRRRKLAKGLGVSHLDLLVATGELLPQEIAEAGAAGVVERDPDSLNAKVRAAVEAVNWDAYERMARIVMDIAEAQFSDQTGRSARITTPVDDTVRPLTGSERGR